MVLGGVSLNSDSLNSSSRESSALFWLLWGPACMHYTNKQTCPHTQLQRKKKYVRHYLNVSAYIYSITNIHKTILFGGIKAQDKIKECMYSEECKYRISNVIAILTVTSPP